MVECKGCRNAFTSGKFWCESCFRTYLQFSESRAAATNANDSVANYAYVGALRTVLGVRRQNESVYGDDWKEQADWELLAMAKMKMKRLEHITIERRGDNDIFDRKVDAMVAIINYTLFMLQNELNKKK